MVQLPEESAVAIQKFIKSKCLPDYTLFNDIRCIEGALDMAASGETFMK